MDTNRMQSFKDGQSSDASENFDVSNQKQPGLFAWSLYNDLSLLDAQPLNGPPSPALLEMQAAFESAISSGGM